MVTLTLTAVPDVPLGDATPTGVVRLHLRDSRPIDKNNKIDEHLRGWANRLNQPWLMGVFLTPGAFHRHRINNAPPHKHHINVRYVRMQPRCHYYSTGCLKLVKKKKRRKTEASQLPTPTCERSVHPLIPLCLIIQLKPFCPWEKVPLKCFRYRLSRNERQQGREIWCEQLRHKNKSRVFLWVH